MEDERYPLVKHESGWSKFWWFIFYVSIVLITLVLPLVGWGIILFGGDLSKWETLGVLGIMKFAPIVWVIIVGIVMYCNYGHEWRSEWRKEDAQFIENIKRKTNGKY